MNAVLSVIIANEHLDKVCTYICEQVAQEKNFQSVSYRKEIYWKDNTMSKIYFEIDVCDAFSESEWIELFDKHLKHHEVIRDEAYLEIDHYSGIDDRNDPFVVFNIPMKLVR